MVPISVNLSRVDFQVCNIYAEIEKIRRYFNLPASLLKIEILESMVTSKPQELRQAIANFHASGYEVWMDDFGSGYSSLNALNDYSFDLVKIDMVFVRHLDDGQLNRLLIPEIAKVAHKLGLKVLA